MKPISKEERRAFGAELITASNRAWAHRGSVEGAFHIEKDFTSYVNQLDVAETRGLITAALRRLMTGRSRDRKIELTTWISSLCKSLAVEQFGHLSDVDYFPDFERTCANMYGTKRKARDAKASTGKKTRARKAKP